MLTKLTVQTALNAELTEHLGYEKHQNSPEGVKNARNGTTRSSLRVIMERSKSTLLETEMAALNPNCCPSIRAVLPKWMTKS